jgi:SurA N-terminal domain
MGRGVGARNVWFLCVATIAAALAIAGGSAASSTSLPAPEELVPNTVARIAEVPPRRGTITKAEFHHGMELAAALADAGPQPKPGERGYERLKTTALKSMFEGIWIVGQAAEWDITVTRGQVKSEIARVKQENFRSAAEFRQFLRESHYTRRDVYERVEIQLLSTELQAQLVKQIDARNEREEQQGFTEFVDEFNERWRSRTVCAPEYVIERCSNGPAPPVAGS